MHWKHRAQAFALYNDARTTLVRDPQPLLDLEQVLASIVADLTAGFAAEAADDYDAASVLYPFWQNYPPDERGRQPRGDQYPWIEVGEHTVGSKLARSVADEFVVQDLGFPTGADQRFVVRGPAIEVATAGLTDAAWLCVDIKSVGPRDDFEHAVMSHNQVSGSGVWRRPNEGVQNDAMVARGSRTCHNFYPALPPLLILPDRSIAPTITMALKPVYSMRPPDPDHTGWSGQPLSRIELITIPNGLLLTENPAYLRRHPGLLYPGKDDKGKDPRKLRARVSFPHLAGIARWRKTRVWTSAGQSRLPRSA